MGCRSQGMNRDDATSQDQPEQIHRCRPRWYFTRREIEENSPSKRDGIDSRKEKQLRSLYCTFVLDLGMKLRVPQATIATAMMFCHRFYMHQSHAKNDWQTIATVSMFLAGKVEETPRLLVDVIVVAYEMLNKRDPSATQRIKQPIVYEKQKKLILIGERLLMATMAFDFNLEHPYKPLVAAMKKLEITQKDVTQVAWNFVNDWLRTPLCLQYKPHYIAAGSLCLAAKFCKVKLPSERGKVWWLEFDVSPHQLEEVIKQMLSLLEDNKKPQMPSSQKKTIQDPVVKRTIADSPESCVLSGSEGTGKSMEGIGQKAGVGESSKQSIDVCAHSSQSLPTQDFGNVRNGEESQYQTSDCGSSRSVVEDGSRTDEGEVHPRSEGPHLMADSQIVSDCVGSSRITFEDDIRTDESEFQPRLGGSHLMAACQVVSECVGPSRIAVENGKTDESEVRTAACQIVSDCGESSKIDNDSGGLSKVDKDRIKAALRKRKSQKTAMKKVVRTLDDDKDTDSWIEEELENGIELGSEAPRKRKYDKTTTKNVVETLNDDKDTDSWIEEELENGIELGSGSAEKRQRV